MADCDTLDSLPEPFDLAVLNEFLFSKLDRHVGVVIRGTSTRHLADPGLHWGEWRPLRGSDERIQMRICPKGIMGASLAQRSAAKITIAYRRFEPKRSEFESAFAMLWPSPQIAEGSTTIAHMFAQGSAPLSARQLNLLAPSVFKHHDAARLIDEPLDANGLEGPCLSKTQRFAVTSPTLHRVIKNSCFNVTSETGVQRTFPGAGSWVLAGELAGVDVPDRQRSCVEEAELQKFDSYTNNMATQLIKGCGAPRALSAAAASLQICDLLSIDGILCLMSDESHSVFADHFHAPSGLPLLIAAAVRVASYPDRFDLPRGTARDEFANRDLCSLFESGWSPFDYGRGVYAIDVVLATALTEAKNCKKAGKDGKDGGAPRAERSHDVKKANGLIRDNLMYMQRVGQRAISGIFGATTAELPTNSRFGRSPRTCDRVEEARRRKLHEILGSKVEEPHSVLPGVSLLQKRVALLNVMNSVENWLRTGTYLGIQINVSNEARAAPDGADSATGDGRHGGDGNGGGGGGGGGGGDGDGGNGGGSGDGGNGGGGGDGESGGDGDGNGTEQFFDAEDMEDAVIVDGSECSAAVKGGPATPGRSGTRKVQKLREMASATDLSPPEQPNAAFQSMIDQMVQDSDVGEGLSIEAFRTAVSYVGQGYWSGPLVHMEMSFSVFASYQSATVTCASCDASVHLLTATFLSTSAGHCPRCYRPRCARCVAQMAAKAQKNGTGAGAGADAAYCKRCAPRKKKK